MTAQTKAGQFRLDVLEHRDAADSGNRFNPDVWTRADLRYLEELKATGPELLRQHVFEAFEESTHKGVTYALVWGFPKGRVHNLSPGESDLQEAVSTLDPLVEAVEQVRYRLRSPQKTIQHLKEATTGLGVSALSKVAYFAKLDTPVGECLIFDTQVTKAILRLDYPELKPLRAKLSVKTKNTLTFDGIVNKTAQSVRLYSVYVELMHKLAQVVGRGTDGAEIERFLFLHGRNL